jgi:hypothetical protein
MGIFPIVMNVLQFWLIDSIVKASSGPVALEPDAEDPMHPDNEPLFNASDDEDDDHRPRRGDIESQLHTRPSHSSLDTHTKSYTTGITTPDDDEHKSIETAAKGQPQDHHAYPPSLSSSFTSASSSSNTPPRHQPTRNKHPTNSTSKPHPSRRPATPPHATHTNPTISTPKDAGVADEWAVSWDDEDDASWGDEPSVAPKQNSNVTHAATIPARPRRLS